MTSASAEDKAEGRAAGQDTARESSGADESHRDRRKRDPGAIAFTVESEEEDDEAGPHERHRGKVGGFKIDLDLGNLKESLRETMKGVSETVKDVMGELANLDLGSEIFRAMGKARARTTTEITQSAGSATGFAITNKWGDVRVMGLPAGDISDEITVRAEISAWGGSDEEAQGILERVDIGLGQEGDQWVLRSGLESATQSRVRVDYEITLPRAMNVSVSSLSGDIWLEELDGEQNIATLSGDISLSDVGSDRHAPMVLKTKSGDVVGGALTGDVRLNSLAGDVEINGFSGNFQCATQSGDVAIQDGAGSVQIKTMSGEVSVELVELGPHPVAITAVSGDVELTVPAGSALDITAKSNSGDVEVEMEIDGRRTEHHVSGSVRGGGHELSVATVSGDVSVSET